MTWIKVRRPPAVSVVPQKLPANALNGGGSVYRLNFNIAEVLITATAILAVDGRGGYRDYGKYRINGIEEFLGVHCFGTETAGGFQHSGDVIPIHRRSVIASVPPPNPIMAAGLGVGPPTYTPGNSQTYDYTRNDLILFPAGGVILSVEPTPFYWAWQT